MTVLTVLTVRVFLLETVGGDRTRPYALTVSGRLYGFYGQVTVETVG